MSDDFWWEILDFFVDIIEEIVELVNKKKNKGEKSSNTLLFFFGANIVCSKEE